MEPNQGIKTWQWVITVIVIIILIVLGYYMFKGEKISNTNNTNITDTGTASDSQVKEINRVVVTDQNPGNIVFISSAQLENPGWVAIHKDNKGIPGDIIGSLYFDKGINPGKITLSEKTVEGSIYYAMIHSDDGDKKFNSSKDFPLKDNMGSIIMKPFRATINITEVKG